MNSISLYKKLYRSIRLRLPCEKRRQLSLKLEKEDRENRTRLIIDRMFPEGTPYVMNGPFQGMKYIATANGSQLLPKILGSYEEPIHEWIREKVLCEHYETIIDVGCAEGYYAVGFALASPNSKIIAFDIDTSALANAKELAVINNVNHRIEFLKSFEASVISSEFGAKKEKKILIFMDVEGAELGLLDSKKNISLLSCDILVELHDCFIPNLSERVIRFFSETHKIEIVFDYPWREGEYKNFEYSLSEEDYAFCLNEVRPKGMRWMFAKRNE